MLEEIAFVWTSLILAYLWQNTDGGTGAEALKDGINSTE